MLQPGAGTRYPLGVEDAAWFARARTRTRTRTRTLTLTLYPDPNPNPRFERALKPATDAQLEEMVVLGRKHAAAWAAEDAKTREKAA